MTLARACIGCGAVVPDSRRRCRTCERKHRAEKAERDKRRGTTRTRGEAGVKLRREVRERFGNRCAALYPDGRRCPIIAGLQMHHVDSNPSNDEEINLVPLCPVHHLEHQDNPDAEFALPQHTVPGLPLLVSTGGRGDLENV